MAFAEELKRDIRHFFPQHPSRRLVELFYSVGLMDFASAAVTLFEPIYLYTLGYPLAGILLFYLLVYALYVPLLPFGGWVVSRIGPERSIAISTLFLVAYYLALAGISVNRDLFWVAPVLFTIQKTLYWPAYHADFLRTSDRLGRGSELSGLWSLSILVYVLGPLLGGLVVEAFSFPALFVVVGILILLSNIPLLRDPAPPVIEPYRIRDVYAQVWQRGVPRQLLANLGYGEELLALTVWPVFLIIVVQDFAKLGALIAAGSLITALVTLAAGKLTDRRNKSNLIQLGSSFQAMFWMLRTLVRTVPGAFIVDTGARIVKNFTYVPFTATLYERAAATPSPLARLVLYEQSLAVGKAIAAVLGIALTLLVGNFTTLFVLGGAFALLYGLL
jgi:MFS family permease